MSVFIGGQLLALLQNSVLHDNKRKSKQPPKAVLKKLPLVSVTQNDQHTFDGSVHANTRLAARVLWIKCIKDVNIRYFLESCVIYVVLTYTLR